MRKTLILVTMCVLAAGAAGCQKEEMTAGEGEPSEQYVYTVQGDEAGYWDIAERVYGDGEMWQHIAQANPNVDQTELEEGDELMIPVVTTEEGEVKTPMSCERQRIY